MNKIPILRVPKNAVTLSEAEAKKVAKLEKKVQELLHEIVTIQAHALGLPKPEGPYNLTVGTTSKKDEKGGGGRGAGPEPEIFFPKPTIHCYAANTIRLTKLFCLCGYQHQVWDCTPQ